MKLARPLMILALVASAACAGQTSDPVAHFTADYGAGDEFKQIDYDFNGDGVNDSLFVAKESFDEDNGAAQPSSWDIYLSKTGGGFHVQEIEDLPGGVLVWPSVAFVGTISELANKRGIVTIKVDNPSEGPPVAHVIAYTFNTDGSVDEHELAEYPAENQNAIFDKYLDATKRTSLTVQDKQK